MPSPLLHRSIFLTALFAVTPASAEPVLQRLLVLPLEAKGGVKVEQVEVISEYLAAEARRIPGYNVMSQTDIERMLSLEMKQQLMGCEATSCLAEIGGALNAQEVLYGSVGKMGERGMVLSLTRISPQTAVSLGGDAERISGKDPERLLQSVSLVLKRLYPTYQPPASRSGALNPAILLALLSAVGGGLQYAAFASIASSSLLFTCPPLAMALGCGSLAACAGMPLFSAWVQAWFADLLGRKQTGFRRGALIGLLLVPLTPLITFPAVSCGALLGAFVTAPALTLFIYGVRAAAPNAVVGEFGTNAMYATLLGALLGANVGSLAAVLWLAVVVPGVQAAFMLPGSRERPVDSDAKLPGLYGPYEEPPHLLKRVLPGGLVAGTEIEEEPAP